MENRRIGGFVEWRIAGIKVSEGWEVWDERRLVRLG